MRNLGERKSASIKNQNALFLEPHIVLLSDVANGVIPIFSTQNRFFRPSVYHEFVETLLGRNEEAPGQRRSLLTPPAEGNPRRYDDSSIVPSSVDPEADENYEKNCERDEEIRCHFCLLWR